MLEERKDEDNSDNMSFHSLNQYSERDVNENAKAQLQPFGKFKPNFQNDSSLSGNSRGADVMVDFASPNHSKISPSKLPYFSSKQQPN